MEYNKHTFSKTEVFATVGNSKQSLLEHTITTIHLTTQQYVMLADINNNTKTAITT